MLEIPSNLLLRFTADFGDMVLKLPVSAARVPRKILERDVIASVEFMQEPIFGF